MKEIIEHFAEITINIATGFAVISLIIAGIAKAMDNEKLYKYAKFSAIIFIIAIIAITILECMLIEPLGIRLIN